MSVQPQLIPLPGHHPVRKLLRDVPVIVGHGLRSALRVDGRRMSGTITLDAPNPMGRKACTLNYTAPKSWSPEHHEAALRVAAHWFRDIGKFQIITKSVLCHVVQRLVEGTSEREMHAAINTYAASKWHREGKRWTVIQKFFLRGQMEKCIDESPELRRERDQVLTAEQLRAREEADAREAAAREQERIERDRRLAERKAARKTVRPLGRSTPPDQTAKQPTAEQPATIASAIEALPATDRWVIPTLLSRKATPEVKARARDKAERVCRAIWPHLPASIQHQVKSRIVASRFRINKQLIDPDELPDHLIFKLRWPQLVATIQAARGSTAGLVAVGTAASQAARRPPTTDKRPEPRPNR